DLRLLRGPRLVRRRELLGGRQLDGGPLLEEVRLEPQRSPGLQRTAAKLVLGLSLGAVALDVDGLTARGRRAVLDRRRASGAGRRREGMDSNWAHRLSARTDRPPRYRVHFARNSARFTSRA